MSTRTRARRGVGGLASVLNVIGLLIVAVFVVHIVLLLLGANPDNGFASTIAYLANLLDLGLSNLFDIGNRVLDVIVDWGLPALAWYAITAVVVRLLRRV